MRRKYADKHAEGGIFFETRVMFAFRNKVILCIFSQFIEKMEKRRRIIWIKYMKNSRNDLHICKKLSQKVNETKILRFLK